MLSKSLKSAAFVRSQNTPTLVAYDPKAAKVVIGEQARELAERYRPVIQDFKLAVGDTDAMFEGRFSGSAGARPQRLWELKAEGDDASRLLSTKEATKAFLKAFLGSLQELPQQLIFGVPASKDKTWMTQYRTHLSEILKEIGFSDTQFFPEPFAVFQYYRHVVELIPQSSQPLAVLVVDFGGGTMDSCVIETTTEGNLSRGGATSVPLGIQSCVGAGKEIDRRLLKCAIQKSKDLQLRQEPVDARLAHRPWVLLVIEQMKIALSEKMKDFRLDEDCKELKEIRELPVGSYHPDKSVRIELTGEDLRSVITGLWRDKSGPGAAVVATITEAKYRKGSLSLQQLDKIIIAGGSSRLPFLRELLIKSINGQIPFKADDVLLGKTSEQAVALGIAVEAAEERTKAQRTHHSIGPCVFNELYLVTAPRRREQAILPRVKIRTELSTVDQSPGTLLAGPMRVDEFTAEYLIDLPFRPHASLIYWFCEKPDTESPEMNRLNVSQDILHLPAKAPSHFKLRITFDPERGLINPEFTFGSETISGVPFHFGGLKLAKDVLSYTGIDFGTSNSYAATLWGTPKEKESKYPVFRISESAGERLRKLEQRIRESRLAGVLTAEAAKDFSKREQASFVFHSIKIEGSSLSKGETEAILDGSTPPISKEMLEPINVRDAYEFCVANTTSLAETPELFMRELHKMVLRDITINNGSYRREQVTLSGMVYAPPDWMDVEPFMTQLAGELKQLDVNKTSLQHAAEIHSKFTSIHPFMDGNGRTARLIMNAILIEVGLPAIVIAHSDKQRYLDGLVSSNKGDISELCMLFAECLESSLEQMAGHTGIEETVDLLGVEETPEVIWIPSHKLAEIMKARIARAPVDRKSRYDAWAAAFDSFREDFRVTCQGFNLHFGESGYHAQLSPYDRLPYERYEDLLRRKPVSKSWLMGLEIESDIQSEKFVFWFTHVSSDFQDCCTTWKSSVQLPPKDVSLAISRRVDGTFQPLRNEPIRLREMAYVNGEWVAMIRGESSNLRIEPMTVMTAAELFLEDAITSYF